jgi:hypothetical protein
MTDQDPRLASRRLPGQGVGGCLASALVLGGIVLLLPGVCSLLVMGAFGFPDVDGGDLIWLISLLIGAGGVWLIVWALRNA